MRHLTTATYSTAVKNEIIKKCTKTKNVIMRLKIPPPTVILKHILCTIPIRVSDRQVHDS